jgi:hypothetical protein
LEFERHVFGWPDPFSGVDHASFERSIDLGAGDEDRRGAGLVDDLSTEAGDAHFEALVVADRRDLFPEPSSHLWRNRRAVAPG